MRIATAALSIALAIGGAVAGYAAVNFGLFDPAPAHAADADSSAYAVGACIHTVADGARKCVVKPGFGDSRTNAGATVAPASRSGRVLVTWPDGTAQELPAAGTET